MRWRPDLVGAALGRPGTAGTPSRCLATDGEVASRAGRRSWPSCKREPCRARAAAHTQPARTSTMVACSRNSSSNGASGKEGEPDGAINTSVCVRVRPLSAKEHARCMQLEGPDVLAFQGTEAFKFERVHGEGASQADVFQEVLAPVEAALNGCNGAVLAYGQTGSGKTHTLFGSLEHAEHAGMVPRAVAHLGLGIAEATASQGAVFKVSLTVVEIYCERIRDLLGPGAGRENLQVKSDKLRGVYVEGAHELQVCGEAEAVRAMAAALASRSTAATHMNESSSRSHCLVTVWVERTMPDGECTVGKLVLADLAGSERQSKTGAAGATLAEGALINKSLSTLANVISALTADRDGAGGAARHVPYRDSKLTRVLQDSLGGTARTVLVCCCSPAAENAAETLSTLRFGARAKGLKCRLQVNQRLSPERLQQMLAAERAARDGLVQEVEALRAALAEARAGCPPVADPASEDPGAARPEERAAGRASSRWAVGIDLMAAAALVAGAVWMPWGGGSCA